MANMNSYRKVTNVLEGKSVGSIPVVPMVREWCSKQAGIEFIEEMDNVEKHVYAQSYCALEFDYDIVWDLFACHSESEAMGSILKISKGYPPSVERPAVEDYERDLPKLRLFDPYHNKRLSTILEGTRRLKKRFYDEIPVMGYVQAPFRHASMLRGSENIMRDMYKAKDNLKELCEIALTSLIVYSVAVIHAGADIIFISDPTSSGNAISKKHWEEWGLPYTTRLVKMIKRSGVKTILHICGDTTDRLESLAQTGVDCLSLDEIVDFERARKILGPNFCLMGNVSTTLLAMGNADEIQEATRAVIEKAGKDSPLLLSGGCLLADICPPENISAMIKAAREYEGTMS
ncbi:MAG TPA: uroporphyrinogen decarboxylase family protein [Desulfomonilaceae bacterium]|nr:uroporphyrinogen decarboxylase family protein [Desulfomonilaceae bacterium]